MNDYWCISSKEDADFIACMDEKLYQLLGDAREPLPLRSGDDWKTDSENKQNAAAVYLLLWNRLEESIMYASMSIALPLTGRRKSNIFQI